MTTGERIQSRRKQLGLTQTELAARLGNKSRASVCTVERDKEDLTTTRIRQYARALETTESYIMGWTEDPEPKKEHKQDLSGDEYLLVTAYRMADEETRDNMMHIARNVVKRGQSSDSRQETA